MKYVFLTIFLLKQTIAIFLKQQDNGFNQAYAEVLNIINNVDILEVSQNLNLE